MRHIGTKESEKKPLPLLEQVEITAFAAEGKAVARVNDLVIFVPYAAPGDIVDLQVTRKKNSYCEARIVKLSHISCILFTFCSEQIEKHTFFESKT